MSDRYISVKAYWIVELRAAWKLAQGDPIQAQKYFDWMMSAEDDIDFKIRREALQDCPTGNPIDFHEFMKPYTVIKEDGTDTVLFRGEKVRN